LQFLRRTITGAHYKEHRAANGGEYEIWLDSHPAGSSNKFLLVRPDQLRLREQVDYFDPPQHHRWTRSGDTDRPRRHGVLLSTPRSGDEMAQMVWSEGQRPNRRFSMIITELFQISVPLRTKLGEIPRLCKGSFGVRSGCRNLGIRKNKIQSAYHSIRKVYARLDLKAKQTEQTNQLIGHVRRLSCLQQQCLKLAPRVCLALPASSYFFFYGYLTEGFLLPLPSRSLAVAVQPFT